jgi:signal transduction histidine kinase
MDLPYPRLYFRMAIYIGSALLVFILVGAVILGLIASFELEGYVATRHSALGRDAAEVLKTGGRSALENWLIEETTAREDVAIYILNQDSVDILGRRLPTGYENFVRNSVVGLPENPGDNFRPLRLAPQIISPDGAVYSFLVMPKSIGIWGSPSTLVGLATVALVVVATVAWLIAGALGRPIRELQIAVRQLASGHIDARVPNRIAARPDELGTLAADFNTMAEQLQTLIDGREQLMREMSHELRSPLARLQASLALAGHRHSFGEAEREQIDAEIKRIDDTIGEMLRFSRLDAPGILAKKLIRIDRLLADLVQVEEVEAKARECEIVVNRNRDLTMIGDPDALRSGFENIIRNAIEHSPAGECIDIEARSETCSHGFFSKKTSPESYRLSPRNCVTRASTRCAIMSIPAS